MLTDEEETAYKEIFTVMDTDKSGTIGLDELQDFLQELPNPPSSGQVHEIFSQCDSDGSGEIDSDEFIDVVETIKLLQNKTTDQIIHAFKRAKAGLVFAAADFSGARWLETAEAVEACRGFASADDASRALRQSLATVPPEPGQPPDTINQDQFCVAAVEATAAMRITQAVGTFAAAAAAVRKRAKQRLMQAEEAEEDGAALMQRSDTTLQQQLSLERTLGEVRVQLAAAQAAQQSAVERVAELEAEAEKLRKENKDIIYENEKLRRKLKSSRAAVGASEDGAAELKRLLELRERERAELQESFESRLSERDAQVQELQQELEALRQQGVKQKQEAGRRSAALALLHKHVGSLEQQNDALRKEMGGADSELMRDQAAREVVLRQMLAEANRALEALQEDIWYRDRKAYLRGEGGKVRMEQWRPDNRWNTDPHIPRRKDAASASASGAGEGASARSVTATSGARAAVEEFSAADGAAAPTRQRRRQAAAARPVETDPSEAEYEVLAAYYHQYQENPAASILEMCARALDPVSSHHPAYWTVGDFRRIRAWMQYPQLPPAAPPGAQRRAGAATPRGQDDAHSGPPIRRGSPRGPVPASSTAGSAPSARGRSASAVAADGDVWRPDVCGMQPPPYAAPRSAQGPGSARGPSPVRLGQGARGTPGASPPPRRVGVP
eukprot:TRINITY_DN4164_c0_g1_i1.p1 TRINITY_DN4164_c0_g1~~TRINITY_DN4164_c0_g1_i1.p1  ORF type:complete len:702 (+),score=238.49 TRINITY_DN4164_c0_g1_i1:92-2107(+)